MVMKNRQLLEWTPAEMPLKHGYKWPWSTWVGVKRQAEPQEPHNMSLLMQHAYARYPQVLCWKVVKLNADPREALGTAKNLQRRYVPKNYVAHNRKLHPSFTEKPRFIMPRFRNVAAKVDNKWNKVPLKEKSCSIILHRRDAVSFPEEEATNLQRQLKADSWSKTENRVPSVLGGGTCRCEVDKNK